MSKLKIETGSSPAEERFSITVTEKGPFLVYGRPPLAEQFIMPNEQNESWYFQEGRRFSTEAEPTALCRCGASKRKPYCGERPCVAPGVAEAREDAVFRIVGHREGPASTVSALSSSDSSGAVSVGSQVAVSWLPSQ